MKYCLSAHQSKEYIKKADEILVEWEDQKKIIDIITVNPNATITLLCGEETLTEKDWTKIKQYNALCNNNFKLCVATDTLLYEAKEQQNIKFFYAHIIGSLYSLMALVDFGVCDIRVGGSLVHQLDFLKTLPVNIRVFANNSTTWLGYKPIIGSWIRPEDLYKLDAIDICEFFYRDMAEQQALYRIYAENKEWPGELYMIVKDIDDQRIMNRMIPPEFQERRSNCAMRCQSGSQCHYCETVAHLANPELLRPIKEKMKDV